MKKLLFLVFAIIAGFSCSQAQNNQPVPPTIAPYKIITTKDQTATFADLPKNRPVILIYFSPDCPHCQKLIRDMKPDMDKFKKFEVVMVTFTDIRMVKTFENDYGLNKYPNFILGTEGYTYTVQRYYRLVHTPFVAVYGKNGKLVKAFEEQPEVKDILAVTNKI
ncbi:MAG: redoxin domain-containing protein [Mucilaginibacter sp.]|nr:redoxin domain-containing protein [Mucilaginibacter sp.]